MKKLIMLFALLSASLVFSSCGGDAAPSISCSPVTDLGSDCGDIQACCNSTKCYYKAGGKRYDCSAFDCSAAAQQVVNDVCNFGRLDAASKAALIDKLIELSSGANMIE